MEIEELLKQLQLQTGASGLPGAPSPLSLEGLTLPVRAPVMPPADPMAARIASLTGGSAPPAPHMLDRVGNWLRGVLGGNETPRGFENLVSPEDIEAERPSLLHLFGDAVFGGPTPTHEMEAKLTDLVNRRQQAASVLEGQRLRAARQDIGRRFAPPVGRLETSDEAATRALGMFNAYLGAGDLEAAKVAAQVAQEPAKKLPPQPLEKIDSGGYTTLMTPQGRIVGHIPKMMNQEQIDKLRFDQQLERERMTETEVRDAESQDFKAAGVFNTQAKPLLDKAPLFPMWRNVVEQARAGNPEAYESFIFNFASMVDPQRIQPRQGLIQILSNLDPSLKGKSEVAIKRITGGVWPKRVIDGAERLANKNMEAAVTLYTQRYNDVVRRHPNATGFLTPPDIAFGDAVRFNTGAAKEGNASKFDVKP